jgi:hypothetical protein
MPFVYPHPEERALEHFQAKWIPVRRPKMRPHKEKRAKPNSIKTGFALAHVSKDGWFETGGFVALLTMRG